MNATPNLLDTIFYHNGQIRLPKNQECFLVSNSFLSEPEWKKDLEQVAEFVSDRTGYDAQMWRKK